MDKLNAHQYFLSAKICSCVVNDMPDPLGSRRITTATVGIDKSPTLFVAIDPQHITLIQSSYSAKKSIDMKASASTGLILDVQPLH